MTSAEKKFLEALEQDDVEHIQAYLRNQVHACLEVKLNWTEIIHCHWATNLIFFAHKQLTAEQSRL